MPQFFKRKNRLPSRSLEEIKGLTQILFIDDHQFEVVELLVDNGWQNTKRLKDIENLDRSEIASAHLFFVDIQGVGRKLGFADEGLGLCRALKEKYPSKFVILYSAQTEGDRFDDTLDIVDARIRKNADQYEFIRKAEQYGRRAFALEESLHRIAEIIGRETGQTMDPNDVKKRVLKLAGKKSFDVESIVKTLKVGVEVAKILFPIVATFLEKSSGSAANVQK